MHRKSLGLDGLFLRRGIEEPAGEGIEARARTSAADALHADARAFNEQEELLGKAFGPRIARLAHQADEPLTLLALVRFDHAARGVTSLGELDCGIGERATARGRLSRPLRH